MRLPGELARRFVTQPGLGPYFIVVLAPGADYRRAITESGVRDELKKAAYLRGRDPLIVHSLDRFARNVEDLRRVVRELNERKVSAEVLKNRLTFSGGADPTGQLMLTMLGAFAEFERELIRERQREGIAIGKVKGVHMGRKRARTRSKVAAVASLIGPFEHDANSEPFPKRLKANIHAASGHVYPLNSPTRFREDPFRISHHKR